MKEVVRNVRCRSAAAFILRYLKLHNRDTQMGEIVRSTEEYQHDFNKHAEVEE